MAGPTTTDTLQNHVSGHTNDTAHFRRQNGANPRAALVQATDRNFYGTTSESNSGGTGTVCKMTAGGMLTTLHTFDSSTEGYDPRGGLVQGTDGNFYGTTLQGGTPYGVATVFKITPAGTLTTLHNFDLTDGWNIEAGLVQGTDGTFYGTTYEGGANEWGTVYNLSVGLGPFVETNPTSAAVRAVVTILGSNLTNTTSVTFNGTPAAFTVISSSEITATVPEGATTGNVTVETPSGTLSSNVNFQVT